MGDIITNWFEAANIKHPKLDQAFLEKACTFAQSLSKEAVSPYTTSTLDQGLKMASLLLDLNCDNQVLAAAIIYPSVYYAQPDKQLITKKLNAEVTKLITGAIRMEAIHDMHRKTDDLNTNQTDNLRKMMLAIVDDVRVVIIKLAERLITLQYLKSATQEQQHYIARQAMDFYGPLANRLGMGQLKWQLEDLSFRYLNNENYFLISKALKMRRSERETFINEMMQSLTTLMKQSDISDFNLTGRAKHIYSIYSKAQRKGVPVEEIYDASALRILLPSIKDCYTALSLVHGEWEHIPHEFDDYVANPKPNGYQSIHTAVIASNGRNVEIQIRTNDMHESAELGVAAHWKYKEGASQKENYEDKIERLREMMKWQTEVTDDQDNTLYRSLFSDRVYVFTPQGDVFDLPAGSTPLDFAYHVHTSIGHRTKGAKVNGKMVTLQHQLETGDRIDIITSKEEHPSRDWMNTQLHYLKTPAAIQKVRLWFKKQNMVRDTATGLDVWEKAARHEQIKKSELSKAAKHFNLKTTNDILAAIGSGNLGAQTVLQYLKSLKQTEEKPEAFTAPIKTTQQLPNKQSSLVIEGIGNLLTHLAQCCKPIPGDTIIGYITQGRGVSIHQAHCSNIQHDLLTRPQRIIEVNWGEKQKGKYAVDLIITADNVSGLIRDVSTVISAEKTALLGLNTRLDNATNQAYISLSIELDTNDSLESLRQQLLKVKGIHQITRA